MGAYSTLYISRKTATGIIAARLPYMSNQELADVLDSLLYDRLYNCVVNETGDKEDDATAVTTLVDLSP